MSSAGAPRAAISGALSRKYASCDAMRFVQMASKAFVVMSERIERLRQRK